MESPSSFTGVHSPVADTSTLFQTQVFFLLVFSPRRSANPPHNIDHQLVVEGTF
jgi:hypothetical protein